jgi:hypothetical protein
VKKIGKSLAGKKKKGKAKPVPVKPTPVQEVSEDPESVDEGAAAVVDPELTKKLQVVTFFFGCPRMAAQYVICGSRPPLAARVCRPRSRLIWHSIDR